MNNKRLFAYLIPFAVYIFLGLILSIFIKNNNIVLVIRVIAVFALLLYYYKYYAFGLSFNLFAIISGVTIFIAWIGLEAVVPNLGSTYFYPESTIFLVFRLISILLLAPIIEEFFVRYFLNRVIVNESLYGWEKLPVYSFTAASFVITVLFFGFSHNRWLAGLITGVILNLVLYKTRKIDDCIMAHFIANLLLVIYILTTHSWGFW